MAEYTMEVNTSYQIPNITVYSKFCDGNQYAFKVVPNDGYVMYDTTANDTEPALDENGSFIFDENSRLVTVPVTYYCKSSDIPLMRPDEPYKWCAIPEDEAFDVDNEQKEGGDEK